MSQPNPVISLLQLNFSFPFYRKNWLKCIFDWEQKEKNMKNENEEKENLFSSLLLRYEAEANVQWCHNKRGNSIARRNEEIRWKVHFVGYWKNQKKKRVHQHHVSMNLLLLSLASLSLFHSQLGSISSQFQHFFSVLQLAASLDGLLSSFFSVWFYFYKLSHGMAL